jgi:NADH-quinone oxidoreductase subunit F
MSSAVQYLPGKEPHSREKRLIFRNVDRAGYDPSMECYLKDGGYEQLKKAIKMERSAITNEVKAAVCGVAAVRASPRE